MSLLTARYALGVGPLRGAVTTGGGTAGHRGESKGYRVASMSEAELLDIFDAPIWKRCWYAGD